MLNFLKQKEYTLVRISLKCPSHVSFNITIQTYQSTSGMHSATSLLNDEPKRK